MGVNGNLTVIPATEFRKVRADPMHYVPRAAGRFDLYREWLSLQVALDTMGSPLNLALRGNRPQGPEESWDECYFAYVTPALVKKIGQALGKVTDDQFIAALKAAGWHPRKREHKYYLGALQTLKDAYRSAARQGACLSILIC